MTNVVNWGILGAANIARKQVVPAMLRAKNAKVVAVATNGDINKANAFANEFDIPNRYGSYEEVLNDTSVDAVYIPLPNHLHAYWVKKAAKNGKHVLCEKPAALTVAETKDMVDVCKKHGVVFMEAFMYQFHDQHRRVKEIIASGEIGEVKLVRSAFSFPLALDSGNIRLNKELGGGSLYDVGCYCIHASRMIFGEEPEQVYATGHVPSDVGVDLSLNAILDFRNGRSAMFHSSFEQPHANEYEVIGTLGKIQVPYAFRPDTSPSGNGEVHVQTITGEAKREVIEGDPYRVQVELVSEAIVAGKEPSYNGTETIKNMQAIEACLQALHTNSLVKL